MEMARVSPGGAVTIPLEIRRRLNIKGGDSLLFLEKDGKFYIDTPTAAESALVAMQDAMSGLAAEAGIRTEADVQKLVDELRYGE